MMRLTYVVPITVQVVTATTAVDLILGENFYSELGFYLLFQLLIMALSVSIFNWYKIKQ